MTYPDATVVTYGYNSRNLLTAVAHPTLGTTTYTYDIEGRPVSETLADGTVRSWAYDGEGRAVSYTEGASTTTLGRDAIGRITGLTGSETASYVYDAAGQLTSATIGPESWSYSYDQLGHVAGVTDDSGSSTMTVDASGRLSTVNGVAASYDSAGRALSVPLPDGTVVDYTYDARGLPTQIVETAPGGGLVEPVEPVEPGALSVCDSIVATITGTPGDDTLIGTPGDDVINGRGGNDITNGRGGNDIICGRGGDDTITGGGGADQIHGGSGTDTINGNGGADVIDGGSGDDIINGDGGADTLYGSAGATPSPAAPAPI